MRRPEDRTGDVIVFVPKPDLERARLIREARAIYESIFPTQVTDDGAAEQAAREPRGFGETATTSMVLDEHSSRWKIGQVS